MKLIIKCIIFLFICNTAMATSIVGDHMFGDILEIVKYENVLSEHDIIYINITDEDYGYVYEYDENSVLGDFLNASIVSGELSVDYSKNYTVISTNTDTLQFLLDGDETLSRAALMGLLTVEGNMRLAANLFKR